MNSIDHPLVSRDLLRLLCLAAGPSGDEGPIAEIMTGAFEAAGLSTGGDRVGNVWATVSGTLPDRPSVAMLAHMDEVGLVVKRVRPDGFLQVVRLGGIGRRSLSARRVRLLGRDGPVPGVIGVQSHHLTDPARMHQLPTVDEAYVDVGASTPEQVRALGVDVGTKAVFEADFVVLNGTRVSTKALDDRACCAVLEAIARRLHERPAPGAVHVAATVREEFDLHGAVHAVRHLRPDLCVVLDVTPAADTPDLAGQHDVHLGGGPSLKLYDFHGRGPLAGYLAPREGVELVEQAAAEAGLPLQREALVGLISDAAAISALPDPPPAICISLPVRYTHSPIETCDLGDLDQLALLVEAAVRIAPQAR